MTIRKGIMQGASTTPLEDRSLIRIAGPDAVSFLQALVSNDVDRVGPERAIYAALLTAQGKYLHDFFIAELDGALMVDCEAARRDDLLRRLTLYKLRAEVEIEPADGLAVHAAWGPGALEALGLAAEPGAATAIGNGTAFTDPRLAAMGARLLLAVGAQIPAGFQPGEAAAWEARRLALGLPDGSRDLEVEQTLLLEAGFDKLNGIDWDKGCYVGQELTARTRYRGLVKKRLLPVSIQGPAPTPGTPVLQDGRIAGAMRSGGGGRGLALLRLDALEAGGPLKAGEAELTPETPDWAEV